MVGVIGTPAKVRLRPLPAQRPVGPTWALGTLAARCPVGSSAGMRQQVRLCAAWSVRGLL